MSEIAVPDKSTSSERLDVLSFDEFAFHVSIAIFPTCIHEVQAFDGSVGTQIVVTQSHVEVHRFHGTFVEEHHIRQVVVDSPESRPHIEALVDLALWNEWHTDGSDHRSRGCHGGHEIFGLGRHPIVVGKPDEAI